MQLMWSLERPKPHLVDLRSSKLPRWPNTYPACDALCANIHYTSDVRDGFKINTTGTYRITRMNLGLGKHNKHITFKLPYLRYLDNIMYIIVNQLKR